MLGELFYDAIMQAHYLYVNVTVFNEDNTEDEDKNNIVEFQKRDDEELIQHGRL